MESEQIFSLRCHTEQAVNLAARCKLVLTNDQKSSRHQIWWSRTGSNRRPPACKAGALPAELRPLDRVKMTNSGKGRRGHPFPSICACCHLNLVGLGRLELPTSRLSSARSNQLSYKPLTPNSQFKDLRLGASIKMQHSAAPGACSSAKKEKRRRRCPAYGAQRSGDRWPLNVSEEIRENCIIRR